MPLKVNVGLSKKIGQPDYGSLGASVNVEYEADSSLLTSDVEGFQRQVRQAFLACHQAVQEELERHRAPETGDDRNGGSAPSVAGRVNGKRNSGEWRGTSRPATDRQVRAIETLGQQLDLYLAEWLQGRYGQSSPRALSIQQASQAIDELKTLAEAPAGDRS